MLHSLWLSLTTPLMPPTPLEMLPCAALALILVLVKPLWRVSRNAVTIAHEGGHAVMAVLAGRRLGAIRLHADTSGTTESVGRAGGVGVMLTTFAGYPAPALWAMLIAWLTGSGRGAPALWLLVLLLFAMLVRIRNCYGLLAMALALASAVALAWWGSATLRSLALGTLASFLAFGSIRPICELFIQRRRGEAQGSDADALQGRTRMPADVWMALWLAIDLAALWFCARWLLGV